MILKPGLSIGQAEQRLMAAFREVGIESSALDARIILQHWLKLDRAGVVRESETLLDEAQRRAIEEAATRRQRREPIAYIVGEQEFWSLPLRVTVNTLVPRPETELVVETGLKLLPPEPGPCIVDLGTGTGAILLALLSERADAHGVGVDRGWATIVVAQYNALKLGLGQRAGFVRGDFSNALAPGSADLLISNPPYIDHLDLAELAPEVKYEPRLALDGGVDGLNAYRRISADARRVLKPGGHAVVEIGWQQSRDVTAIFTRAGLASVGGPRKDLAGHDRVLVFKAN